MIWLKYASVLNVFELMSSLVGFYYWGKIKNTYWKYFPIYLAIVFVTDIIGVVYLHYFKELIINIDIYRYWGIPIQFFFFFWLYYQYFKNSKISYLPFVGTGLFVILWIVEEIWLRENKLLFGTLAYSTGCIMLLIFLLAYIKSLTKSEELIDFKKNMMLWTSLGVLLFYIGTLPFFGMRTPLFEVFPELFYTFNSIQYFLCCSMYFLFTIAFIWGQPK
ncbi:MAG: hypothetical protein IPN87_00260 [Saprospiraceae bacterium]|nr:hypothetical protein [Candidatus Brachybacter algidus]